MEDRKGKAMNSKKDSLNFPVNSSLLGLFWTLAEGKEDKRFEATQLMVKILTDKQGSDTALSQELDYALKRLVKGLASSRKYARLGYSTALAQVLRAFPVITTRHVTKKIFEQLSPSQMDLKSERSNLMLGKVMAYCALIQAETLFTADPGQVRDVVKQLLYIRSKKMPIHQICVQALCQIIKQVTSETFSEYIWPQFEEEMKCGWEKCTPDTLQLLMVISKHHSSVLSKQFLTEHWKSKKIITEKNMEFLKNTMMKSTSDHPIIHNVCYDIVQKAMKQGDFFAVFWKNVVSDKLVTQTLERRFMGLQLVVFALRAATTAEQVKIIMTETIVQAIITNICDKNKPLHAASKKLCDDLVNFVAGCPNLDMQLAVISSLISPPSTVLFDSVTKTKTIHKMVTKLSPEGSAIWADIMMDIILGKTDTALGDMTNQGSEDLTKWALCELLRLVTSPSMASKSGWYLKLVQFLFLHGFFEVKKTNTTILLCERLEGEGVAEPCRRHLQGAFYKSLDKLSTFKHPDQSSANDIRPYLNLLKSATDYAQLLLTSDKYVVPHQELLPEMKEEWENVLTAVEQIRSKHTKDKNIDEGHAFELLYMCLGFQLFSVPQDAIEILSDLHVCSKKALAKKRRLSMKPDTEPEWVEVVTEMLLSLLSQESHLVRVVVTNVFKIISPHMTTPALDLVLNVVKPAGGEDGPLGFEDEDESDEEEDVSGSENEENAAEEEEEEESSDDDEESEEEGEVDENLRKNLKEALGSASVGSDEEDVASDLDDDAMFKVDDALSEAFKNMVKNKKNSKDEKEKKQQLKNFKLKSLDLLNNFASSEPAPHLAMKLLMPLLEIMDQSAQDKTIADIGRKASTVFHNLIQPRKYVSDPMLEKELLPATIQELIEFSAGVHGVQMVLEVASACIFLVRILLGLEHNLGPSPVRTRSKSALECSVNKSEKKTNALYDEVQKVIGENLESFCLKRDTHLNHMLFHSMFDRMPGIMWPQAPRLLELLQNEAIRIFCRTQVCSMLTAMVKKPTVDSIGEIAWGTFADSLVDILPKMLNDVRSADPKPRFVHELLLLLLRASSASPDTMTKLLTPDVRETVTSLKSIAKKDTKAVIRKILHLGQMAQKRKTADKPDDSSPRKMPRITEENDRTNGFSVSPASSQKENTLTQGPERNGKTPKSDKKKKKCKQQSPHAEDKLVDGNENELDEPAMKTPKRLLDTELEKAEVKSSGKKKKRQSTDGLDNKAFTKLKTPTLQSPQENGEVSTPEAIKKLKKKKKTPVKFEGLDDPEGLGASLEILTPVPKFNRRRSTRLSLMTESTPKGALK